MDSDIHSGHRKRIRQKILNTGLKSFSDHEILEFLLFYTIPRRNTNEIAHELIDRFGSLAELSQASIEEICQVKWISPKSAAFLKYMPQLADYIFTSDTRPLLNSTSAATELLRKEFEGENENCVKLCCLTPSLRLICVTTVFRGELADAAKDPMLIISALLEADSRDIILANNHTDGSLVPSRQELAAVSRLRRLFESLEIRLADHIIVSNDGLALSLNDAGYFSAMKLDQTNRY